MRWVSRHCSLLHCWTWVWCYALDHAQLQQTVHWFDSCGSADAVFDTQRRPPQRASAPKAYAGTLIFGVRGPHPDHHATCISH